MRPSNSCAVDPSFMRRVHSDEFYARVRKYGGWQTVGAARICEIFEELITPEFPGFNPIKPRLFARPVDRDITLLVELQALKGASYEFKWGVSLAYVPHRWEKGLRWHRSISAATFDLWEHCPDLEMLRDSPPGAFTAFTMLGERCFRDELRIAFDTAGPAIKARFASLTDLDGVRRMAHGQASLYHHFPPPELVFAFTQARVGDADEAEQTLRALGRRYDLRDPKGNLAAALRQVSTNAQR